MNYKLKTLAIMAITTSLCFGYNKTDVPEGWASQGGGTTGGRGGTEVTVSSMGELSSAAGSSGKKIILVKPGNYNGSFTVNGDKSVLGIAPGVRINGTMKISGKNIIIRNIQIKDKGCSSFNACRSGSDCVYIGGSGSQNIWLDHLDISDGMDGNLDITKGPNNITITWSKFHYSSSSKPHAFSNLIAGSDNESESEGKLNITYAYCWWADNVIERQPRGRFGKIHVLNNLYTSERCNYIVGPGKKMEMIIEANVFNTKGGSEGKNDVVFDWGGAWTSIDNIGTNPGDKTTKKGSVFTPPYTIMKMDVSRVESAVRAGAGNVMTLGQTSVFEKIKTNNVVAQPRITTTNSGWTLQNPGSTALSFVVVTLQGKTVLQTTTLEAGKNIQMPTTASTLVVKFKGANAPSDIFVPVVN